MEWVWSCYRAGMQRVMVTLEVVCYGAGMELVWSWHCEDGGVHRHWRLVMVTDAYNYDMCFDRGDGDANHENDLWW